MTTSRPVALVTGASSGIGRGAALALLDAGFQVIGTSRDASRVVASTGSPFSTSTWPAKSRPAHWSRVIARFGRIGVLVNNAGIGSVGAAEELSVAEQQRVVDVNVFGVIRMTPAVLPHMRAQGAGRIIKHLVRAGFRSSTAHGRLRCVQHALEGYSESVDHEVRAPSSGGWDKQLHQSV
jgi:short-subunit dehydrogenase